MAHFRLELGPVPLHHQVYLDLRAALDAGEWRPGDLLPPERQLAQEAVEELSALVEEPVA